MTLPTKVQANEEGRGDRDGQEKQRCSRCTHRALGSAAIGEPVVPSDEPIELEFDNLLAPSGYEARLQEFWATTEDQDLIN